MAALIAIETVVLVLLTLLVAGLLRSHAAILRQLHELGAGIDGANTGPTSVDAPRALTPPATGHGDASDIVGPGLGDDVVSVRVRGVEHRTLLAFLSSGCLTCRAFWDAFADGPVGLPPDVRLVVVTKDADEESLSTLAKLAPGHLPLVMSSDTWRDYTVPGSPYFVLADGASARVVGEGTGASWPQVLGLLGQSDADGAAHARDARLRRDHGAPTAAMIDVTNADRIDQELFAAGIRPGDPSLYRTADDSYTHTHEPHG
jgi:hypothetical protein